MGEETEARKAEVLVRFSASNLVFIDAVRHLQYAAREYIERLAVTPDFVGRDGVAIRQPCVLRSEDSTVPCVQSKIDEHVRIVHPRDGHESVCDD